MMGSPSGDIPGDWEALRVLVIEARLRAAQSGSGRLDADELARVIAQHWEAAVRHVRRSEEDDDD